MKNLIIFGLFVIALVFVQFAQAQTVDEVIDKYINALGGKDKLANLASVYMEGVSVRNGNEITSKTYKVQDKLYRYDVNFGAGSFTILVTPEKGWQTNFRNGGAFEAMTDEMLKGFLTQTDCAGPMVNYAAKGHKAELIGKETADSVECYKIKLTTKAGKEISYWIDSKTYLVHQSSQKTMGRNGEVEVITAYSDYRAVDGIQFPFSAELKGGGFGGGSTTYEKIEVNKPTDQKLYKPE